MNKLAVGTSKDWLGVLVAKWRRNGLRIGVVPTMGALHDGHLSLVSAAKAECDRVVVTIFVNPTQFSPTEDLTKYPRTLGDDIEKLSATGADVVFTPSECEVYPQGFSTFVDPPEVARPAEGVYRASHFRGVTTVVLKLLNMTRADLAFFGQKDFQQVAVVRRMAVDLNVPCEIRMCPTVRDPDGLAMSSRNRYLSPAERQIALSISRTLNQEAASIVEGERDGSLIMSRMIDSLTKAGTTHVDYAFPGDPETLTLMTQIRFPVVLLIAARVGNTRLIDNVLIESDAVV